MAWDNTIEGALYGTRTVLRTLLAAGWTSWQTAIANAGLTYTLPTVIPAADVTIDDNHPTSIADFPQIIITWEPPRVVGYQVGGTSNWSTEITICVAWWFAHDGTGDSKLDPYEVCTLIQQDIRQMILLALRNVAGGMVAQTPCKITAVEDVGGFVNRPLSNGATYALTGMIEVKVTQDAQYQ